MSHVKQPEAKCLSEIQMIIPHPDGKRLLLYPANNYWKLPSYISELGTYQKTEDWINDAKEQCRLSLNFIVLRCVWEKVRIRKRRPSQFRAILLVETYGLVGEMPADSQWVDMEGAQITHPDKAAQKAIDNELAEHRIGRESRLRALYARPGWYAIAEEWIKAQLVSKGCHPVQRIVQVRWTTRGTVLRAETECGNFFLKASPPFVNEASLTELLAVVIPEQVKMPVAIDKERRMMLMTDYGETIGNVLLPENQAERFARELATMQKATVGKVQILKNAGMQVLSMEWMESNLDFLLFHDEVVKIMKADILKVLREASSEIQRDCKRIGKMNLPLTLVHNDLDFDNIYQLDGNAGPHRMLDWSDAYIGHPFLDSPSRANNVYRHEWIAYFPATHWSDSSVAMKDLWACQELTNAFRHLATAFRVLLEIPDMDPQARTEIEGEGFDQMRQCLETLSTNYLSDEAFATYIKRGTKKYRRGMMKVRGRRSIARTRLDSFTSSV